MEETSSDVCSVWADGISFSEGIGFLLELVSIFLKLLEAVFVISTYPILVARERAKGGNGVIFCGENSRLQSHYYSSV